MKNIEAQVVNNVDPMKMDTLAAVQKQEIGVAHPSPAENNIHDAPIADEPKSVTGLIEKIKKFFHALWLSEILL